MTTTSLPLTTTTPDHLGRSPLTYVSDAAARWWLVDAVPPRSPSVTGYGPKIPTRFRLALSSGPARRVYAMSYGNAASLYVVIDGKPAHLTVDLEHAPIERGRYQISQGPDGLKFTATP